MHLPPQNQSTLARFAGWARLAPLSVDQEPLPPHLKQFFPQACPFRLYVLSAAFRVTMRARAARTQLS